MLLRDAWRTVPKAAWIRAIVLAILWCALAQTAEAQEPDAATPASAITAPKAHVFGAWSLAPPLVAIGLAMLTRRVIASLLAGVFVGAVIQLWPLGGGWGQFAGNVLAHTCESVLWKNLIDADLLRVFAFSAMMGAMIGVMYASGGMHGLVRAITPWASNRRRGQMTGWLMGMLIFFDDYANTLLLGNTLRPVADRLRISREKLAYIVDSTAAPVAGLAIISTWVATEIQYIQEGYARLGLPDGSYQGMTVFLETIPYRFYPLLALFFVVVVAVTGRDFGPMLRAERKTAHGEDDPGLSNRLEQDPAEITPPPGRPQRWINALLPVAVVMGVLVWLVLATGYQRLANSGPVGWQAAFNAGDSYLALVYAALAGLLTAIGLALTQRLLTGSQIRIAASFGARLIIPALVILWLSACLKDVTGPDGLQTADYVGRWLETAVSAMWLPTLAFVLASLVALATGTSWGTMGILMPLVIGVTYLVLGDESGGASSSVAVGLLAGAAAPPGWFSISPYDPILLATVGSVLAGAIFGDHCSPISDTTVLSSVASGCDHFAHVWTQMPYAVLVGAISILLGTIPAGLGWNPWWMIGVAAVALVGWIYAVGRRVDQRE